MTTIRPPIFIWEPNELLAFDSIHSAEGFVEPYDADDGTVYDAEGRLLRFETAEGSRPWSAGVVLREQEATPTHQPELRQAIMRAAAAAGAPLDGSAPLAALVEQALSRFRAAR
ncbi:MAG TPA: hypothetical protein VHY83_03275 [Solirubrobacteraceae bacterium]|nr:hypothetical protein [Solirubrobacteraceae bacterium]